MKKTLIHLSALAFAATGFAQAPPVLSNLKFSGFFQYRMEWTRNPRVIASDAGYSQMAPSGPANNDSKNESRTLVWMNVDNEFDGKTRFHGLLYAEHLGGRTTDTSIQVREGFVAAKLGSWELAAGRFYPALGLGTINGGPYMDGGQVAFANDTFRFNSYTVKFGSPGDRGDYYMGDKAACTFTLGDVKVMPAKGLTLSGTWMYDISTRDPAPNVLGGKFYRSWAVGTEYKYVKDEIPWFTVKGEYGQNSAAMARKFNGTTTPYAVTTCTEGPIPKAYFVQAKVLGANPGKPMTGGFFVEYRKADAGFDAMYMSHPDTWNAPFNWTSPATGGLANNVKGVEIGAELTLLPRLILKVNYGFMKLVNTTSTLDLGSPVLAVITSVTPTATTPIIGTLTGAQNKGNQDFCTAALFYLF